MGGTKIPTVNDVVNSGKKMLNQAEQTVSDLGKNLETNVQTRVNDLAMLTKGNFNNVGQSILMAGLTNNPVAMLANPNDLKNVIGETGSQRYKSEQIQNAANDQANADAATALEQLRLNATAVAGLVDAKKRAPGRAQTFLSGGSNAPNTLLTIIGNR